VPADHLLQHSLQFKKPNATGHFVPQASFGANLDQPLSETST
jgi:hypothetical protein